MANWEYGDFHNANKREKPHKNLFSCLGNSAYKNMNIKKRPEKSDSFPVSQLENTCLKKYRYK